MVRFSFETFHTYFVIQIIKFVLLYFSLYIIDGDGYRGEDGDGNEARKKTVTGMKNGETNILHMDEASQVILFNSYSILGVLIELS